MGAAASGPGAHIPAIQPPADGDRKAKIAAMTQGLADAFAAAKPDIAVIIGNDQMEIFDDRLVPALSVFSGAATVPRCPWRSSASLST